MGKSIYIDENGNEQILSSSPSALSGLLDTDITTPQANQVLAYDNDLKVVNSDISSIIDNGNVTVTGKTGTTVDVTSGYKFGNLVGFTSRMSANLTSGTWATVATVNYPPTSTINGPVVATNDGEYLGFYSIETSGDIKIFPKRNNTAYFSLLASYKTTYH